MRTRILLLIFILIGVTPGPSLHAQSADGTAPHGRDGTESIGLSRAELKDLVTTVKDPETRARLLTRLKGLLAATDRTGKPEVAAESRIAEALSGRIDRISEELVAGAALLLDTPRIAAWIRDQAEHKASRDLWLNVLWKSLAVLAAGLFVELGARRLLSRTRNAIEARARKKLQLHLLAARTSLDLVSIASFATAAYAALFLLDAGEATRAVAVPLVAASVAARAAAVLALTFFAPGAPHMRITELDDETANYLALWVRRFANIGAYGYFLVEATTSLGLPHGGQFLLERAVGLFLALLAVIFVLQNRRSVAAWIRGDGGPLGMLRRRFAAIWHLLATVYFGSVYLVWALEIRDGFEFVFRATVISVAIIAAAKFFTAGSRLALDKGFGLRPELVRRYPGLAERANRYFSALHHTISGAIATLAALAILKAWGIDSFGWIDSEAASRVIGSLVSSAIVVVVAVALWEIASSAIERYLESGGNGDPGSRARTLLPLLRRALMIVTATVIGLVLLSEIGVDIGPLLAGAGVVGLAVGFGAQTLVKDVITGVFILAENQFAVDDVVRVGDRSGVVEDITIRTIRLRDLKGNVHIIPFSSVSTVENMTREFSRYLFDIGIAYREDVDEVIGVLEALGEELRTDLAYGGWIREPLEIMGLNELGDSAVVVRARFTTDPGRQWQVGREFNRRIKRRFDELGIEIPFPHQTVYFGEDKGGGAPPAFVRVRDEKEAGAV